MRRTGSFHCGLKTEVSIGGAMEREITLRVFASGATPGLHPCQFRVERVWRVWTRRYSWW